jgi:hypothetical protein
MDTEHTLTEPTRSEHARAEHARAKQPRAEQPRTEQPRTERARAERARTEPKTAILRRLREVVRHGRDEGAATAEYVVATMAAVGFAGLLVLILRSDEVRGMLTDLVRSALTVAG